MEEKGRLNHLLMLQGRIISISVTGPLREGIQAFMAFLKIKRQRLLKWRTSGLQHVPVEKRNPLITTTKGTGELILHALDQGVEYIILGLGGSATNDGGAGMLRL